MFSSVAGVSSRHKTLQQEGFLPGFSGVPLHLRSSSWHLEKQPSLLLLTCSPNWTVVSWRGFLSTCLWDVSHCAAFRTETEDENPTMFPVCVLNTKLLLQPRIQHTEKKMNTCQKFPIRWRLKRRHHCWADANRPRVHPAWGSSPQLVMCILYRKRQKERKPAASPFASLQDCWACPILFFRTWYGNTSWTG